MGQSGRRLRVVPSAHEAVPAGQQDEELWVKAEPSELKRARDFAAAAAEACGFDDAGRYQFMLAASETLTNAIEHGSPFPDGKYRLRAVMEGDLLSLYVSDCGSSSGWDLTDPGLLSERGRGLGLVSLLMDEVELRPTDERTTIRLSKRLRA
jgi:anti-sigma regulatory factor (Ser/Thr protein kinase)